MRIQYIISIILFFPALLLQTTLIPLIAVNGIVPDLLIILLVFYTISNGQIFGTVLGFVYGFLFDLLTGSLVGSAIMSKLLAGFVAGYFSSETKRDNYLKPFNFSLIVFIAALVNSIVHSFFSAIDFNVTILNLLINHAFLPALFTSVIGIFLIFFYPKRSPF